MNAHGRTRLILAHSFAIIFIIGGIWADKFLVNEVNRSYQVLNKIVAQHRGMTQFVMLLGNTTSDTNSRVVTHETFFRYPVGSTIVIKERVLHPFRLQYWAMLLISCIVYATFTAYRAFDISINPPYSKAQDI